MLLNDNEFKDAPDLFKQAYDLYKARDFHEAKKLLDDCTEYLYSNYLRGMSILEDLNSQSNDKELQQVIAYLKQFKMQSAVVYANVEDALGLTHFYLAVLSQQQGNQDKAKQYVELAKEYLISATENEPNYFSAWHNLGLLEFYLNNLEAVFSAFETAMQTLEFIPSQANRAKILHSLANTYNKTGENYFYEEKFDKALKALNLAESNYADACVVMTACSVSLTRAFEQDRMENFNLLGHAHYKLEQYELAKQNYLQALSLNKTNSVTLNQLGMCAFKSGNFAEAINYFNRYILTARDQDRIDGTQEEVDGWLNRTEALNKNGKYLAAKDSASVGLSMLPAEHDDRPAFANELSSASLAEQSNAACTLQRFFRKHRSANVEGANGNGVVANLADNSNKCTL